jgi:hypothetical protein
MKSVWAIIIGAALVAVLGGIYFSGNGHAPAGQPPLIEMSNSQLNTLQADFNRTAGSLRVILLLSPT